ncbi:hypothetical protein C8A00DRAFT_36641 [Chaetomidium leptoderma]|uniref:SUZ domain-containing protein n=1 Tax=Chaetomidium leptoderma TaxID=669021 RepID=A0AAN6ZUN3_9PEZI|nr:hypothetical protein C8A00DRAFT_36641 [Chaetomidium leptoderma]
MGKGNKIPDAWDDDDWELQADRAAKEDPSELEPQQEAPMTRAERLAKHAAEQRELWESAETPKDQPFLPPTTTNTPPLATPFKPALKVLSRKPAPKIVARRDPVTGLEQLTLQDDEDDEAEQKKQETPEEMRKRQQQEREEKQRRYDEARAKIFGDSNPSSGQSSPRTGTPPLGGGGAEGRQSHRGRGRGRGGGRGRDQDNNGRQERRQQPPNNPQAAGGGGTRELFDPGYAPKPGFNLQKRGDASAQAGNKSSIPREEDQIIRAPRGPDGSGRGGFGFARRGGDQG